MLNFIGEYFSPREQREDAPPAAGSGDAEASEAALDLSPPSPKVEKGASGEDLRASGAAVEARGRDQRVTTHLTLPSDELGCTLDGRRERAPTLLHSVRAA